MKLIRVLFIGLQVLMASIATAEEQRNFYEEPGLHPFKDPVSDLNETIDPFSGMLQLRHTDVTVPGNGGLDIEINRFYLNHQDGQGEMPAYSSMYGVGWTMHFGRIVVPRAHSDKVCSQSLWQTTTADNPSLEHPDGSRELLVLSSDPNAYLVTKSNWRMNCVSGGMHVTAPDGTLYIMDAYSSIAVAGGDIESSWYTARIVDVHGNSITIDYINHSRGYLLIDKVTGYNSDGLIDGRLVTFTYVSLDEEDPDACLKLTEISSNGQLWQYNYELLAGFDPGYTFCGYNLTEVVLPSGQRWQYEYYPRDNVVPGKFSLKKVTYPYGGVFDYTYQHVQFDPSNVHKTTSVATKNTSGPNLAPGAWTYTFAPNTYPASSGLADLTTITQPNGRTEYVHQGASLTGYGNLWAVGLLLKTSVYSAADVLIEDVTTNWDKRLVSYENNWNGTYRDDETYAPVMLVQHNWRNAGNHTVTYSNYDTYGNPGTVVESSNVGDELDRETTYTYYSDTSAWIIGVTDDETITGIGTVNRTINALGQLVSEDKYGVITNYTYTPDGDLHTVTDARNNTVTTSDYYRGIARVEQHPEAVTINRVVNPTGTVASVTNGRGFTKSFSYDALNRLSGIDYPVNADVAIVWSATGKTLTRGNYQEAVLFDGFGKEVQVTRTDTASGEVITKTTGYDALGQKIFESYPNSVDGIDYTYDAIGRLTRLDHPDGVFRSYAFSNGGATVAETDERGNTTEIFYRVFGHPDKDKVPREIVSPDGICTHIYHNALNQTLRIFQGEDDPLDPSNCLGFNRIFAYDSNYFLASEDHPETGLTVFGRDAVGNMISRQVGASAVTSFTYDGQNRLTFTDYPGTTPDVTRSYDENGNLRRVDNADSQHEYLYDQNDNLQTEIVDIGTNVYTINYSYDLNDFVASIIYPSGRAIGYAPDAFGRPTKVAPYVTNVDYYPSGQVQQVSYANGQITDITLNNRLWVERMHSHGVAAATDLTYQYDAIGNVASITDALDALNNRLLGYDANNRLDSAAGRWGTASFVYNGRGDMEEKYVSASHTLNLYQQAQLLTTIAYNPTIIDGSVYATRYDLLGYDDYGNIAAIESHDTTDPINNGIIQEKFFTYDDAGNLRLARKAQFLSLSTDHNYGYDGNNMRVSKITAGAVGVSQAEYVYAKSGNLLGEYEPSINSVYGKEYFYLGAQQVASAQQNRLPVANAGPDASYYASQLATLDGSASSDPDGGIVSHAWLQLTGTPVSLSDPAAVSPTFTTPAVTVLETLTFQLTVTDNDGESSTDTVDIQVIPNAAPVADAGPDQTVFAGNTVQLDGSNSSDVEGAVTYQWAQISGPAVSLNGGTSASPTFTALVNGSNYALGFQLTVTDNLGVTDSDVVSVTVNDPNVDADSDGLADYWEISSFGSIAAFSGSDDPDGDGVSNAQEYVEGTDPTTPAPAPGQVAGVQAVAGSSQNILFWNHQVSVQSYNLYWSTTPGVTKVTGTKIAGVTQPFVHAGLTNGTNYYYVVTAVNNAGESTESAEVFSQPGVPGWNPQVALPVNASPDAVAMSDRGDILLARITDTSGARNLVVERYREGQGWVSAVQLASQAYSPSVDMNSRGDAMVVWRTYDGATNSMWSATYDAARNVWSAPVYVAQVYSAYDVTLLNDGSALLLCRNSNIVCSQAYSPLHGWEAQVDVGLINGNINIFPPRFSVNETGQAVAVWQNGLQVMSSILTPGAGWSAATAISDAPSNTAQVREAEVGIDANGNVLAIWIQIVPENRIGYDLELWSGSYEAVTGSWGAPEMLERFASYSSSFEAELAVSASGDAIVAWSNTTYSYDVIATYRPVGGDWSRARAVNKNLNGHRASHPRIGIDASGNATVIFREAESDYYPDTFGRVDVLAARYDKAQGGFGNPVIISDRSLGDVTYFNNDARLLVSGSGSAIAIFEQYDAHIYGQVGGGPSNFYLSRYEVSPPPNQPPTANAGADQTVTEGDPVVLDGSASSDPEGNLSSYLWVQTSGPAVTLTNPTSAVASFTAPSVTLDTDFGFELTVTDDIGQSATDAVIITVAIPVNNPPIANAGIDQTVTEGDAVTLDGSASSDPEGNLVSYQWVQTLGPAVTLTNPTGAIASFTAPAVTLNTDLTFELTVTDDIAQTGTDSVTITVQPIGGGGDTTPPVTTGTFNRSVNKGAPVFDITLSANEPATTYFRVTGQGTVTAGGTDTTAWQIYTGPVTVDVAKKGTANFDYYSVDTAGNSEATRTEVLQ